VNHRQTRFINEYAADPNGTQAAITAGYAESSAHVTATRLLKNPKIQKALRTLQTKTADKVELTHQYVLEGLMGIATDTDATNSARVRAYELLGKHQGMFTDRLEITDMPSRELVAEWINAIEDDLNRH
jgi:phage terminase small subunit